MADRQDKDQGVSLGGILRLGVWFLIFTLLTVWVLNRASQPPVQDIAYTEFKRAVEDGRVWEVTFRDQAIQGRLRNESGDGPDPARFTTIMPAVEDRELIPLLERQGVRIHAEATDGWWRAVLISLLPWVLILALVIFLVRRFQRGMATGAGGMFDFGKSRARRFSEGMTNVTFADVAGLDNAKRDLQEIIDYLRDPQKFARLGAKIPRGILLMGPPGTGKTLLAKAVAGEANVPFFSVSASEFIEMFVGVGAARVRDMFKSAREAAPSVVFIDELDAVGRARGAGVGGGNDEREQTLNQILSEMDGFEEHETVVVLAATNRPDVLDQALLRPGRFDRKTTLDLPRRETRQRILEVHTRRMPLAQDVDLKVVAERTIGFSGAELENLANEAALLAGRDAKDKIDMQAFEQARDKLVLGDAREEGMSEEEKRVVAFHESGHALLAALLPSAEPPDKITIIPRGRALGATEQIPEEERYNLNESYLRDRIGVMLGGRIAEKEVFGQVSSGAENDLQQATRLARRMVGHWGMSDKVGPVAYHQEEDHAFLGQEVARAREFSEETAREIDEEVRRIVGEVEEHATALIKANRALLADLAGALLQHETLELEDIRRLLPAKAPVHSGPAPS